MESLQQVNVSREVYGPTIIRIHKPKIPELRPLVEIRYTGRRNLQQHLGKAVDHAEISDLLYEGAEILQKVRALLGAKNCPGKSPQSIFFPFVGPRPTGVNHGFAVRFDQIVLNSFQQRSTTLPVERPHSEQRLIKKILFVAVRHRAG